jgi:hypothetical protein
MIRVKVCEVRRQFIVDSGSDVSLIQPGVWGGKIKSSAATTIGVTGNRTRWVGEQEIRFVLNGCIYEHTFGILPLLTDANGILGMDFLIKTRASINLGKGEIRMAKGEKSNHNPSDRGSYPDESRQRGEMRRKRRGCRAGRRKEEREAIVGSPQVRKYSSTQRSPSRKLPIGQDTSQRKGWICPMWRASHISGIPQGPRIMSTHDQG